jgi:hypothetical protein
MAIVGSAMMPAAELVMMPAVELAAAATEPERGACYGKEKDEDSSPPHHPSAAQPGNAFLVRLAGGGKGFGEEPGECSGSEGSGSKDSGSECSGTIGLGDFARVGIGALGTTEESEESAAVLASSVIVETQQWRC